jgi:hypothetical protein
MKHQTHRRAEPVYIAHPGTGERHDRQCDAGASRELVARRATQNPEEVRAAERELAEFKKAINEKRTGSGETSLYP